MGVFSPKFLILMHYVKNGRFLVTPSSSPGGDKDMGPWVSYWKFNFGQFLFEAFLTTIDNFGSLQPETSRAPKELGGGEF